MMVRKHVSRLLVELADSICPFEKRGGGDYLTGLPTTLRFMPELAKHLSAHRVGLFYIDIRRFRSVEALYGRDVCNRILKTVADTLLDTDILFYGPRRKLGVCSLVGDDFLIFVDHPADFSIELFQNEYESLRNALERYINEAIAGYELIDPIALHIGYIELDNSNNQHIDAVLYQAIKEASQTAKRYSNPKQHADWQFMRQIIMDRNVRTLYQPIVSLKDASIIGQEALSRGPAGSDFESPFSLFAAAKSYRCSLELENLCTDISIANTQQNMGANCLLFLNMNPLHLNSVNYRNGLLQETLSKYDIPFTQVVLELTERTEIADYDNLREVLSYYRKQGFRIAIDDAGAGYSSLQAIAELIPDYVKIDMSLVRGIDRNATKRVLVETLLDFSCKINARVICEGIETREEIKTLCDMGCDYGQGFFLARPGALQQDINAEAQECIKYFSILNRRHAQAMPSKLADITFALESLPPETNVEQIMDMFKNNKGLNGIAVCYGSSPLGIVMRDRLNAMLSTRFGYDLFQKKPVTDVMDPEPLILPWHVNIEDAARQLAPRLERGFTDHIIVTREDRYLGLVSVGKMVETMASLQLEQAKEANPLSGLPGNRCITQRLICEIEDPKSRMVVLYLDLDNFKAFNDCYGFEHGDQAILLTAEIIVQAVRAEGNPGDLVAHLGGDDFVVVTTLERANGIAALIISRFDNEIQDLYDDEDLVNGFIISEDRSGMPYNFSIMSISVAGINAGGGAFENHLEIGEIAAEVKKYAKTLPGSNYQTNRRKARLNRSHDPLCLEAIVSSSSNHAMRTFSPVDIGI